ncbi:MAG: hypothetical protein ACO20H_02245 [Bacteriovoracaceae bacterium]
MANLDTILSDHKSREKISSYKKEENHKNSSLRPTYSKIPDIFFDEILQDFKLTRPEIMTLLFLYRQVWCRPNLYKAYGISQIMSHTEMGKALDLSLEEVYSALRKVEGFGFITTIRSGQYFVRRFFTKSNDLKFSQTYDDFEN